MRIVSHLLYFQYILNKKNVKHFNRVYEYLTFFNRINVKNRGRFLRFNNSQIFNV